MFVPYFQQTWPTKVAFINTEASFTAKDPWNHDRQTVFCIDNYLVVYAFAKKEQIKVTPDSLRRSGGYRRSIWSKTDKVTRFLPESLAELWSSKQVSSEALPCLLHEIQPVLDASDNALILNSRAKLRFVLQSFRWAVFATYGTFGLVAAIGAQMLPKATLTSRTGVVVMIAASLASGIGVFWLSLDYKFFRKKRRRMRQMAWLLERCKTLPVEQAGGAPPNTTEDLDNDARLPSRSPETPKNDSVLSKIVTPRKPRVKFDWDYDYLPDRATDKRKAGVPFGIVTPRKPRLHIFYEAETDGALIQRELPFVVGVLGDFSGDPSQPMQPFSSRKFIQIDKDNFDEVMVLIGPGLNLHVENTLAGDRSEMAVELNFKSIEDFEPGRVADQVPALKALIETRTKLRDRVSNVDRSDDLENVPKMLSHDQQILAEIDRRLSAQLNTIMHSRRFLKLEGAWRGLNYLVINSETGRNLKIRILNTSKRDLYCDLVKAPNFEHSLLFQNVYEEEFGSAHGEPFGFLIGDYEWTHARDDMDTLRCLSNVAAAACSPFISAASPSLLGLENWSDLSKRRDLAKIYDAIEYGKWRAFRDNEDSRFVCLVVPRVLARAPYGKATKAIDAFDYKEEDGVAGAQRDDTYCWMNAAYVLGARMTEVFFRTGSCVAIRGEETGGRVEDLPSRSLKPGNGDGDVTSSTETPIDRDRDAELSRLGFLPLLHVKNRPYALFFSSSTVKKPNLYDRPDASANAAICARLPYVMATSRFAHYLRFMARDRLVNITDAANCEKWLNLWISNYVDPNGNADAQSKVAKPLREARVEVQEIPDKPGSYQVVAYLRPWLRLWPVSEELSTAMRVVAPIPSYSVRSETVGIGSAKIESRAAPKSEKILDRYETNLQWARDSLNGSYYTGFDPVSDSKVFLYPVSDDMVTEDRKCEIRKLIALKHPHLVNIIGFGRSPREIHGEYGGEEAHLIVTESFEGSSLRDILKTRERLQEPEILVIMAGILSAVSCLQDNNVNVGTIRPERVLLSTDGSIRLMHLFIEERYRYSGPVIRPRDWMSYDVPMSPHYDEHSGWCYSLGIVLYEMLTGVAPKQHRVKERGESFFPHSMPPLASSIAPVRPIFDTVIASAMSERPEQRYATPADFAAALAGCGKTPCPPRERYDSLSSVLMEAWRCVVRIGRQANCSATRARRAWCRSSIRCAPSTRW